MGKPEARAVEAAGCVETERGETGGGGDGFDCSRQRRELLVLS
jgi:hypothetical protein